MGDDNDDDCDLGTDFGKLSERESALTRDLLERRRAVEEQAAKLNYFSKWLQEAGVIAFLDLLLADSGTTPEARQRAQELRDRLMQSARAD
jgi:hypothetical protein